MRYIILLIFSLFFVTSYGQTKYETPKIKGKDVSIEDLKMDYTARFRVEYKIKQANYEDVSERINGLGEIIIISKDSLKLPKSKKEFKIGEKYYEQVEGDTAYSFEFMDHKKRFVTTVLFGEDDIIIIVIADEHGNGYLYSVEVM